MHELKLNIGARFNLISRTIPLIAVRAIDYRAKIVVDATVGILVRFCGKVRSS